MDIVSQEVRSRMMSGIRGKNTKPELVLRRGLFFRGFRYLTHDRRLPGTPDLVFPQYHAVVIINGCFWHGHGCHLFKWPKSNSNFWRAKILGNKKNDRKHQRMLRTAGWRVLTTWECAIKGPHRRPMQDFFDKVSTWIESNRKKYVLTGLPRKVVR